MGLIFFIIELCISIAIFLAMAYSLYTAQISRAARQVVSEGLNNLDYKQREGDVGNNPFSELDIPF